MSLTASEEINAPADSQQMQGSAWRGVLVGLVPLLMLLGVVIAVLVLTTLVRRLANSSGFFVEQSAAAISLVVGLALAAVVYASALIVILRRIKSWERSVGLARQARAALLMLAVTAVIVALPVMLAIVLPQHPAP